MCSETDLGGAHTSDRPDLALLRGQAAATLHHRVESMMKHKAARVVVPGLQESDSAEVNSQSRRHASHAMASGVCLRFLACMHRCFSIVHIIAHVHCASMARTDVVSNQVSW